MPPARPQAQHGVNGWVLQDMEWDPETGVAIFEYSNTISRTTLQEVRVQPTREGHFNWEHMRDRPVNVLTLIREYDG